MAASHGRFVWYELMTTDMEAAKAFYAKVVGWGAQDVSMPRMPYTLFTVEGVSVGGLMGLPEDAKKIGERSSWIGYVGVDDVDAAAERIERLGGTVHVPPQNMLDISRFAVVADPQLATLALVQWLKPRREQPAEPTAPGRIRWHELFAADREKAFAFYREVFGWQEANPENHATGTYQQFSAGGETIGGFLTKPATVPVPFWLYYFNVGNIDAALTRVKASGGQILEGPLEVSGDGWILQCADPQGAMFALVGTRSHKPIGYFERDAARDASDPQSRRWSW
ncbi:MAG TPA: VOC family protein [Xanthobacteraceae bacterium]|nr:VOC family protein [Xanthobacteraceae bacterium]